MGTYTAISQEDRVGSASRVWQIVAFFGPIAAVVTALGWAAFIYLIQRERYQMQIELARLIVATKK